MTRSDDIYSLLQWAKEKALSEHNAKCESCRVYKLCGDTTAGEGGLCVGAEFAFHEMVEKIQNMRVSQRPHVVEG